MFNDYEILLTSGLKCKLLLKDEEQDTKQKPKGKIATDAEKSWPRKHQQSKKLSHSQETM